MYDICPIACRVPNTSAIKHTHATRNMELGTNRKKQKSKKITKGTDRIAVEIETALGNGSFWVSKRG